MRARFTFIYFSNGYKLRCLSIVDIVRSSAYNKKEICENI